MAAPLTPGPIGRAMRALFPTRMPAIYPDLYPTHMDVPWGTGPNEVLDIYPHPMGGAGRSVLFHLHAGAGTSGDHKQLALSGSGGGNALAWYLGTRFTPRFDVVAVNYEQWAWNNPTPVTHIAPWAGISNPTPHPQNVNRLDALWTWAMANASTYGWDTSKFHLMGSSHGGTLAMLGRFANVWPIRSLIVENPIPDYRDPLVWWPVGQGMSGAASSLAWDQVPDADKDACSAILAFAGGLPTAYAPTYALNPMAGDGVLPYGSGPNGSVHDALQWQNLVDELSANVSASDWKGKLYPRLGWESPKTGVAISADVFAFMASH